MDSKLIFSMGFSLGGSKAAAENQKSNYLFAIQKRERNCVDLIWLRPVLEPGHGMFLSTMVLSCYTRLQLERDMRNGLIMTVHSSLP